MCADLHEIFVSEVVILQGARDHSWVAVVGGVLTAGIFGFFVLAGGLPSFSRRWGVWGHQQCPGFFLGIGYVWVLHLWGWGP